MLALGHFPQEAHHIPMIAHLLHDPALRLHLLRQLWMVLGVLVDLYEWTCTFLTAYYWLSYLYLYTFPKDPSPILYFLPATCT